MRRFKQLNSFKINAFVIGTGNAFNNIDAAESTQKEENTMKARKEMVRMGTKIGAAFGGVVFLFFGFLPGFYFGSFGALVVLKHLMGGPVEPSVLVRMIIAVGIMLGIVCIASVSIVIGSIVGTALGYASEALAVPPVETEEVNYQSVNGKKVHA